MFVPDLTTTLVTDHSTSLRKIELVTEKAAFLHKNLDSPAISAHANDPWALVSAVEAFANANEVPMLISRAKMEVVRDAVLAPMRPRPRVIVELGAYVGNSAVGWGAILRDLWADGDGDEEDKGKGKPHVYALEMDAAIARCARDLVRLAGLQNTVTVLEGAASDSLRRLHDDGRLPAGSVDMVFIDHWEKYYVPDLQLCEKLGLFHKGSVACADNTDFPGAPTYVRYVKGGGSGEPGAVRYESKSVRVEREAKQSIVEVSEVVEV